VDKKTKFPTEFKLEYFHPLHLGTTGSTEFEGEKIGEILNVLRKEHKKIGKWAQGIIHSHHTMGAFFSSTDTEQLEEGANEYFYPSLVVASEKEKKAFAFAYLDQYSNPICNEISSENIADQYYVQEGWEKQAESIKKDAAKESALTSYGGSYYEGTWYDRNTKNKKQERLAFGQVSITNHNHKSLSNNYSYGYADDTPYYSGKDPAYDYREDLLLKKAELWIMSDDDKADHYSDCLQAYDNKLISKAEFKSQISNMGLNWEGDPIHGKSIPKK
jgi:hypothetical protein|tara:strand:+ start:947 stop:1768 length:822 start_codon:yes stop_codon:yes gene_type:complete